jgi:BirA family biotin operon repressor/biotin-[acetyl-CoA-carboxylase] ligase
VASPFSDLSRPPLSAARLDRELRRGPLWREVRVLETTASTNAEVAAAARAGAAEGLVVVAEVQSAGRGRLDREWASPPRAGLLVSVLLRPVRDVAAWPLLPLLTGVAVADAVVERAEVEARLKWPNDVMVNGRKLAGILAERVDDAVVIGVGLNVSTRFDELPVDSATSIAIAGGIADREPLLKVMLRNLAHAYAAWHDTADPDAAVIPAYRQRCETIGQHVRIQLPGGDVVRGLATSIDDSGGLVVLDERTGTERAWLVGDVTHVRKAD